MMILQQTREQLRLFLFTCATCAALLTPARADLHDYIKKPEPAFKWTLQEKISNSQGTIYDLHLVSQTWQGITWEHQVQVYQPKGVAPTETMVIFNTGGSANLANAALGMGLAANIKSPIAILYHIPNQPLLDGKREDGLIAETYVRYLNTKDENWPLLFPMAKSVVKAMDALQAFAEQEWKMKVKQFIITGGSKRGWTSWMTAATGDKRVKAIAPLVIDTLNMREQMAYQLTSFGAYSLMINDYTSRGLVPMPNTPAAQKLWSMVDPYTYRDNLRLPKFIGNGANDPYWTTDALNLYWDGLKGDKWVCYVPNAGHDLQQRKDDGTLDRARALNSLAAFARHVIFNKPMPKLRWKHDDANGRERHSVRSLRLTINANPAPVAARLWVAHAPTRDFRQAKWTEQTVTLNGSRVVGEVAPPTEGFVAFFGELEYEIDGLRYYLSTQMRIAGK
jgi:PhoPQ-activated pathogenicity-related protein